MCYAEKITTGSVKVYVGSVVIHKGKFWLKSGLKAIMKQYEKNPNVTEIRVEFD